jgi:SNF2 family DNA or RNA helicase
MLHESNLRPYQQIMIDHIVETPKCAAWAFMGAGKSVSTLTAIDRMMLAGMLNKPTLIIAPLRVARDVWPEEVRGWSQLQHLRVVPILGTPSQRLAALQQTADIYTINFENLEWLIGLLWDRWPFDMVVVDEATKLKSLRASVKKHPKTGTEFVSGQGGQRALALLKVVYQHKPSRFVELSGTPAPNGLQDLWGQVYFLDYGQRLGNTYNAFRNRWFIQSFDGFSIEPTTNAQVEIQDRVKDICLSLKSEDWFDLAKPIERNIYVELPPDARKQYRDMERKLLADISGEKIEAFNAGARTMKCLQMAAGACYTGNTTDPGERKWVEAHKAKLDALDEIVEEAGGQPILVAYNFKADLARLLKRFPQGKQLDQNSATIKAWNAGKIPLLFTHPASAGHGLNLQMGSNILVYFSLDWNFENHAQIAERIGPVRQAQAGLNRNVYIYKIIARNTIDEDVLKVLETKRTIQDVLMESLKRRAA